MLGSLFLLAVLGSPAALAIVVLAVRLRVAVRERANRSFAVRARAAWRDGLRRPVWPGLVAAALGAALLTAGLERLYLGTVSNGPRWGFDVVLLSMALALLAALGWSAFVGTASAAVARARGFGAGTVSGLFLLAAVAVGTAAAHLPLRATYLADPGRFPVVPNLGDGDLLMPFDVLLIGLLWAAPWPVLAAALGSRATSHSQPARDVWQTLLDLATADLPENRAPWGTALRAELAAIDPPAERRRFALGGVWSTLQSGLPRGAWPQALGAAVVVAGVTLAASRWSLAHDRSGILGVWIFFPSTLLLPVALGASWRHRSFGAGWRTGTLAGAAVLIAVLAVSLPEAAVWASRHAGYLSTGDAVPPTWQAAVGDVLRPEFLLAMIFQWTASLTTGAAIGTALASRRPPQAPPTTRNTRPTPATPRLP
ncbi:hypothetical protein ABIH81_15530 [Micromonospora sp. HUAS YX12]|uniref:Uncharacterized protein n=1 Tax=Micromonospora sp. HUAS YX12 TaxID=3156396 RepID=A0AAU7R8M4_9ACTN